VLFHGLRSVTGDNNRERVLALPIFIFSPPYLTLRPPLWRPSKLRTESHWRNSMIAAFTITGQLVSAIVAVN
jgi:hypothetical protein